MAIASKKPDFGIDFIVLICYYICIKNNSSLQHVAYMVGKHLSSKLLYGQKQKRGRITGLWCLSPYMLHPIQGVIRMEIPHKLPRVYIEQVEPIFASLHNNVLTFAVDYQITYFNHVVPSFQVV